MEKARIVLYDDLVIIDETETFFTDAKNLESIVISCLRTTPGALVAEVYVKDKLKSKMTLTNKGKPKKMSIHPNWGGRRAGAGGKRKGEEVLSSKVCFRVDEETLEFLKNLLDKKGEYIRKAIQEKRERDKERVVSNGYPLFVYYILPSSASKADCTSLLRVRAYLVVWRKVV